MTHGFLHKQFFSELEFNTHTNKNKQASGEHPLILCLFPPQKPFNQSQEDTFISHQKQP